MCWATGHDHPIHLTFILLYLVITFFSNVDVPLCSVPAWGTSPGWNEYYSITDICIECQKWTFQCASMIIPCILCSFSCNYLFCHRRFSFIFLRGRRFSSSFYKCIFSRLKWVLQTSVLNAKNGHFNVHLFCIDAYLL